MAKPACFDISEARKLHVGGEDAGDWSYEGCETVLHTGELECRCTHLTLFAGLFRGLTLTFQSPLRNKTDQNGVWPRPRETIGALAVPFETTSSQGSKCSLAAARNRLSQRLPAAGGGRMQRAAWDSGLETRSAEACQG